MYFAEPSEVRSRLPNRSETVLISANALGDSGARRAPSSVCGLEALQAG